MNDLDERSIVDKWVDFFAEHESDSGCDANDHRDLIAGVMAYAATGKEVDGFLLNAWRTEDERRVIRNALAFIEESDEFAPVGTPEREWFFQILETVSDET